MHACLKEYLSEKTRVLVTHQIQFLEECDAVIVLGHGEVLIHGTFTEVMNSGVLNADLFADIKKSKNTQVEQSNESRKSQVPLHASENDSGESEQPTRSNTGQSYVAQYIFYFGGGGPSPFVLHCSDFLQTAP